MGRQAGVARGRVAERMKELGVTAFSKVGDTCQTQGSSEGGGATLEEEEEGSARGAREGGHGAEGTEEDWGEYTTDQEIKVCQCEQQTQHHDKASFLELATDRPALAHTVVVAEEEVLPGKKDTARIQKTERLWRIQVLIFGRKLPQRCDSSCVTTTCFQFHTYVLGCLIRGGGVAKVRVFRDGWLSVVCTPNKKSRYFVGEKRPILVSGCNG